MAKPSYLQTLDKGKLLTGKNFPEFANTWNYAVNRLSNLKGDRDANPQSGKITVDESDPEHPIIRFVKDADGEECITGDAEGSEAVSGNVQAKGAEGSGLTVKTWKQGNQQFLSVGLRGKADSETFGIHNVKDSGGNATGIKIFSTGDVQLEGGGAEDSVDVLTGFSLGLNGSELQVTWHKKKIKGVATEDVADGAPERLMLLENVDVVNSVSYSNPNCTQSRTTVTAFSGTPIENDPNATVFTTTPHSAEHGGA